MRRLARASGSCHGRLPVQSEVTIIPVLAAGFDEHWLTRER
jgi:hypothetical protein